MRSIFIILALMIPLLGNARKEKKVVSEYMIHRVIQDYGSESGFEVIRIGPLAADILKGAVRMSLSKDNSPEAREVGKVIKQINKLIVVDYEGCSYETRTMINRDLEKVLDPGNLLMEIKDGENSMLLYGILTDKEKSIKDFVLYTPQSCTLICLFGSIPADILNRINKD
ncbi:MAG: DUF4252 domain-containing protein [Bacteroidaceae bacterium]|nr:DUF4252 domain-containing protein [Bacteroidaceae bacterium]